MEIMTAVDTAVMTISSNAAPNCGKDKEKQTKADRAQRGSGDGSCLGTIHAEKPRYAEDQAKQTEKRTRPSADEERRAHQLNPSLADAGQRAQADAEDQRGGGDAQTEAGVAERVRLLRRSCHDYHPFDLSFVDLLSSEYMPCR